MNLDNITPQGYILAMIIRDDGERILLGDGAYVFKDSQQHFQPNTFANDVVELQGTDGQLLAGQVRRTAVQTFAGYIGDASTSQQRVEQYRKQFLMFFRKKFHYTAVYIFHDGSAIQRKRGYIAAAPAVPELYQRFPEWSVGLNFEDPNYYEYAEDDEGNEIYAHAVQIAISNAVSGGLIWDNNGATSDELGYTGTPIDGNGKNFQLTNTSDKILKSAELLGDATQDGTPTPDSPVPVNVVTGEQTVKITGKNQQPTTWAQDFVNAINNSTLASLETFDGKNCLSFQPSAGYNSYPTKNFTLGVEFKENTQYTISFDEHSTTSNRHVAFYYTDGTYSYGTSTSADTWNHIVLTSTAGKTVAYIAPFYTSGTTHIDIDTFQLELGSTATTYEPYQGQEYEVNLGKNLFDKDNANVLNAYLSTTAGVILANSTDRVVWLKINKNSTYTVSLTQKALSTATSVDDFAVGIYTTQPQIGSSGTRLAYTPRQSATADEAFSLTFDSGANEYVAIKVANTSKTDFNATLATLQLELGSQTTYAPYFTPIELAKIGNYQDRIYKADGKWYIEKQVGKVVLDGSETWNLFALSGRVCFYTNVADGIGNNILSDNFSQSSSNSYPDSGTILYNGDSNKNMLFRMLDDTTITTVADFKTWLASNPTTVYYALATPTTTEITNQALIDQLDSLQHANTYTDLTNFSTSSVYLNGFLSVKAYPKGGTPTGGYIWEAGGAGGPTTLTVDGVDNAYPIWTVPGPATNPTLTNITTGQTISWTGTVPNGQELVIDMANQTASLSGANVFEFVSGSWLTLEPGNNRISYSAINATDPSKLEWNGVTG